MRNRPLLFEGLRCEGCLLLHCNRALASVSVVAASAGLLLLVVAVVMSSLLLYFAILTRVCEEKAEMPSVSLQYCIY